MTNRYAPKPPRTGQRKHPADLRAEQDRRAAEAESRRLLASTLANWRKIPGGLNRDLPR